MPNWCTNSVRVTGKKEDLEDFIKKAQGKVIDNDKVETFSLETLYPTPKELLSEPSPNNDVELSKKFMELYGADDWYRWRVKNWGTKWDVDSASRSEMEKTPRKDIDLYEIEYFFDSAWSPPVDGFTKISEQFPDISFFMHFEECGCAFVGTAEIQNGNCSLVEHDWNSEEGKQLRYDKSEYNDNGDMIIDEEGNPTMLIVETEVCDAATPDQKAIEILE